MSQVLPSTTQPLPPIEGTAATGTLVTIADYQHITQDFDAAPADLDRALNDATEMVALQCNRTLLYGQYQELVYLYRNGFVYPSSLPIDRNREIDSSYGVLQPNNPGLANTVVQGAAIWAGWINPLPWNIALVGVIPPEIQVTYWGGYSRDGSVGEKIPAKLARIIAKVAWFILHPASLAGMPGGAASTNVGGVSIGGSLSSFVLADPELRNEIRRFTRRQAKAW